MSYLFGIITTFANVEGHWSIRFQKMIEELDVQLNVTIGGVRLRKLGIRTDVGDVMFQLGTMILTPTITCTFGIDTTIGLVEGGTHVVDVPIETEDFGSPK